MFSWFKKKSENTRVSLSIGLIREVLESADNNERAYILLMSAVLRKSFLEVREFPIHDILDKPLDYNRKVLMNLFNVLEDTRNANLKLMSQTKKTMKKLDGYFPEFAESHATLANRGTEVWLATLGAGILPEKRGDVREIWKTLRNSIGSIDYAIKKVAMVEKMTGAMTGQVASVCDSYDYEELKELCQYVPSTFS